MMLIMIMAAMAIIFSALSMLHWCSGEEEGRGQEDLYNPEHGGHHGKCQHPPHGVPPPTLHFSALSMLHWCSGEEEGRGQEDLYNPAHRGHHGKCQHPPPGVPPHTLQRWTGAVAGMQRSYCQPWRSPWHLDGTGKHHRGTSDDWVCKKLCRWPAQGETIIGGVQQCLSGTLFIRRTLKDTLCLTNLGRSNLLSWEWHSNFFYVNWQAVKHSNNYLTKIGKTGKQS